MYDRGDKVLTGEKNHRMKDKWLTMHRSMTIADFQNSELLFVRDGISTSKFKVYNGAENLILIVGFLITTTKPAFPQEPLL